MSQKKAHANEGWEPDDPAPALRDRLAKLVEEEADAQENVLQMEELLKSAKARLNHVRQVSIPEVLYEAGAEEMKLEDGTKVKLADIVTGSFASLEEEAKEKATAWIVDHDGGDIIKTAVELSFGRTEHNQALSIAAELKEKGFNVDVSSGVHAQTLFKFVRELLEDGREVPLELLGVEVIRQAKITKSRPKKGRA